MRYAGILAGGQGTRMGLTAMPKQFLLVKEQPIIIHTIDQFLISEEIDCIIIAVPEQWKEHMILILDKYYNKHDIKVIVGGSDRNGTIMEICNYIVKSNSNSESNILVTHDAVRPFVTSRIIKDNIDAIECDDCYVVDTVIEAIDTIVESIDGKVISNIPDRKIMYQGQTPQTFKVETFIEIYNKLSQEEKEKLTDAAKIYNMAGKKARIVKGDQINIKITSPFDLSLANNIVEMKENSHNDNKKL